VQNGKYDVVVIGSGIGGIVSAALLVRSGYKTLCIEKRPRLGGRFSTNEIDGFKLPTGALFVHKSGEFTRVLKDLGLFNKLELRDCPDLVAKMSGKDHHFAGKGRLRMMMDILLKTDAATGEKGKLAAAAGKEMMGQKLMNAFRVGTSGKDRNAYSMTVRDWLNQYTEDKQVHELFDSFCAGYAMAREWELPAGELFGVMAKTAGMTDVWMAVHGNITIVEELANVIRENGDVWDNAPVKEIIMKGKQVHSVIVKHNGKDEEIECNICISDIGPKETVAITGAEHFGDEYMRECRVKLRPHPFVFVFIASDIPLCAKEGQHCTYMVTGARRIQGCVPMTNTCPELAPEGQHFLYVVGEPQSSLLPFDEEHEKKLIMEDIHEFFPDFEKHGRIIDYEPRNIDHDLPEGRTWQTISYFVPRETPIKNMFMVGDACQSPGLIGTSGCAAGAMDVVNIIKKKFKPAQ